MTTERNFGNAWRLVVLCVLFNIASPPVHAETFTQAWAQHYNGPGNLNDFARAVAVDTNGNVYVVGYATSTNGLHDYVTIGYSSSGTGLWTNYYDGPANSDDSAQAVAVGPSGNVYVTGYSWGLNFNLDYATIAYSSAGAPLWTNRYDGPANGDDAARAIAVGEDGNVFVTGESYGLDSLAGSSLSDYATIAYTSNGVAIWTNRYNGPGTAEVGNDTDIVTDIAVATNGNVYVTGYSRGDSTGYDYATLAYSNAGVPLWTNRFDHPNHDDDYARAIAVDANGNVFVTGEAYDADNSEEYVTIAYTSTGVALWTNSYNGRPGAFKDAATAVQASANGSVVVTGSSRSNTTDFATICYSLSGVAQWTNRFSGHSNRGATAAAVAIAPKNQVIVAGASASVGAPSDLVAVAYSDVGLPLWTNRYNGPANGFDAPQTEKSLVVGLDGSVFVTGISDSDPSNNTVNDFVTIKYAALPTVVLTSATNQMVVDWVGSALETSTNLLNWQTVTNAAKPHLISPPRAAAFFRAVQ